ncbi:uncharacterized protein LOC109534657 [Dendroctonus ponderosae]|uniref:Uncharacterized protein n=1 Tax=Dendroctonus ponderosae TaxID=77166 RepID=U4UBX2_DENPD|nr:uncharacterized protein LOC109534657 [Dendroctonus ponderosae]ERL87440.1 hypothetical protein D910_04832 [Dendroctonus ponderosae]KAH1012785.1 hypothetical protein HUJ05_011881 [Dendroctonus ponderosae]
MDYTYCLRNSGDNGNLKEKLNGMRSDLTLLKEKLYLEKLYLEKALLAKQQQEQADRQSCGFKQSDYQLFAHKSERQSNRSEPAILMNKTYLRDIEKKCDNELKKLNDYVFNINELRSTWIKMRRAQRLNLANAENPEKEISSLSVPRQYLKGKVFYIDSDQY